MAKKKAQKTSKAAPKKTTKADRTAILADMKSNSLTAKQAAKKCGISFWTIYGWKKSRNAGKGAKPGKKSSTTRSTVKSVPRADGSFRETLRPLIARLVREEIARMVG